MKISYNWLKDYIDIPVSVEELSEILTNCGLEVEEIEYVYTDTVFTIGLTPNRVDASSHIGVARDIAAVINAGGKHNLEVKLPDISEFKVNNNLLNVAVIIEDKEACPRYTGITISDVKVKDSPQWLKDRLMSIGVNPINNIVDITNYVLFEYGQPLHAFDMKYIEGNTVVIKKHNKSFKFVTLDEVERIITPDDLMICNKNKSMCIAGVFGGIKSGVTEKTTALFLESAYFNPASVRKTSNRLGLKTEASFRFERGADPSITKIAIKRAAMMLAEIADGKISSDIIDIYPKPIQKQKIELSFQKVEKLCGVGIDKELQIKILKDLDFEILEQNSESIIVLAPYSKVDVTREIDVIEEILRIYGYNNVPFSERMKSNLAISPKPNPEIIRDNVSDLLTAQGFYEIMTNSLTNKDYYYEALSFNVGEIVSIMNPLSSELGVLRQSMIFSGIEVIVYNLNRKQHNLKFFEFGKTYKRINNDYGACVTEQFEETDVLALLLTGDVFPVNWKYSEEKISCFHLKNIVSMLLQRLAVNENNIEVEALNTPLLNGLTYNLKNGISIVDLGEINKKVLTKFGCAQEVFFADIKWNNLIGHLANQKTISEEISKYPEVQRDISMLVDKTVSFSDIHNIVKTTAGENLRSVNLFDIYQGKNIPDDKISYAISITLQDSRKTLTDKETDELVNKIKDALISKINASIR